MVVLGQNSEKPEVLNYYPTSIEDIKRSRHNKFIILFSGKHCPPCKMLKSWLETYTPCAPLPIYHIDAQSSEPWIGNLNTLYNVQNIPRLVITDSTLKAQADFVGYDQPKLDEGFKKHFAKH
ncbi:hypothetical protein ENBRE01_1630 [Enteropsectra breve]|nr:hypothetical protein ENBRE01_1630 [Enteropsectra breve]